MMASMCGNLHDILTKVKVMFEFAELTNSMLDLLAKEWSRNSIYNAKQHSIDRMRQNWTRVTLFFKKKNDKLSSPLQLFTKIIAEFCLNFKCNCVF
jgi:hypothetical protein